ncbi:MAG: hypothetical protein U9R07_11955 [Pseudomonadota bacterium]|nr:hypothetical protein [Pseudomonadota bacterium]
MKLQGNITLGELGLPPSDGPIENYWRMGELRAGLSFRFWRGFLGRSQPVISDCLAERLPGRPWLLQVWEPLLTKAPSPARCSPYCCYARTVIFYHRPYISAPARPSRFGGKWHWCRPGDGFVKFDQIETRLGNEDLVEFDGDIFEIGCGRIMWHHQRWWLHTSGRRQASKLRAVQ